MQRNNRDKWKVREKEGPGEGEIEKERIYIVGHATALGKPILARALTTAQLNAYFSPNHRTTTATPSPPQHTHQPYTKALYNTHTTRTTILNFPHITAQPQLKLAEYHAHMPQKI